MSSWLTKQKSIIVTYRTDGEYSLAIGFLTKKISDIQHTYRSFLERYRAYVVSERLSAFTDLQQYLRNYLVEKKHHDYTQLSTGSFETYKYDKTDILLLSVIATQSRITLTQLAQQLSLSVTATKNRLQTVRKANVIVAYRALITYHLLGKEYYKVDVIVNEYDIVPGLKEFVQQHPNILFRNITIGGNDFEFDAEFSSQQEFYEMINTIKNLFPEQIRSYTY